MQMYHFAPTPPPWWSVPLHPITAWCDSIERFLKAWNYYLEQRASLCRRFGNTLQWYNMLVVQAREHIDTYIKMCQVATPEDSSVCEDDEPAQRPDKQPVAGHFAQGSQASEVLRTQCPLCFGGDLEGCGGENTQTDDKHSPDIRVCIDACFQLKCHSSPTDPAYNHPSSYFIDPECPTMKKVIRPCQHSPLRPLSGGSKKTGSSARKRKHDSLSTNHMDQSVEEDGFDGDMPIPRSVLHECNESFIAADEALIKASMIFFDNTGVMALLCHHDCVLWVANMKSTGEKQFYAITLLLTLLQHLPTRTKVGTFYDIACKLHKSAIKWGFFGDTLKQMTFSVSVFHAYGFGLSDGEGCECLWSMLKHLIPVLPVSGFRGWLQRHRIATSTRCSKALQDLTACGVPEEVLRAEWEAQSNKQGTKAVEQVLLLREARTAGEDELRHLQGLFSHAVVAEASHERNDKLSHCLKCLEAALGVDQMANLQGMRNSAYLCNRMNARALKNCLCSKLREQRFELARIEHSYMHSVNENKLHDHTEEQIKCKEPRIKELVWKDNKLCLSLAQHIESKCAPPNSFAPMQINLHRVFQIDIDDPIWVDVGLEDEEIGLVP
ncbi:hypothetical protein K439DRAFT_1646179 [Ramaria rubella]|nr:hypothetical protein K439DRAFT_1646179 [Ramaria rubella]